MVPQVGDKVRYLRAPFWEGIVIGTFTMNDEPGLSIRYDEHGSWRWCHRDDFEVIERKNI